MSTDQVLLGVGLILVLAVGSQVLASRLRIPALIILLPAGFIAGALTTDVNPDRLLGAAFQPLVSLAVAVILYDSGLALQWGKVRGRARRVVPRLVIWGVPVTMAFAAVLAAPLLGMSAGAALMTGAILVVSGPTVVGPLLAFVRPSDRLQRILSCCLSASAWPVRRSASRCCGCACASSIWTMCSAPPASSRAWWGWRPSATSSVTTPG